MEPWAVALIPTAVLSAVLLAAVILLVVGIFLQPRWLLRVVSRGLPHAVFYHDPPVNAVALTFDDSPCEHVTPQILDLLKANGCSATFFVIGSNFDHSPELIERIHAEGHEMGNHTMYDEPNWKLSAKEFEAQLLDVDARLQPYFFKSPDGKPIKWFRPGHGWFTPKMRKVFTKHGYRLALGSVYANDPLFTNSSGPIAAFFLWKMYPGAVIILHDRLPQKLQTLEVLQKILPVLRERGYSVTTLSDLLQLREGSVAVVQKPSASPTAASL